MVNTALIRNNKRILQNYCRLRHQSAYDLNRETAAHQGGTDANFQEDATYSQIMVIVDLVRDPEEMETANLDLVLKNTWGEIFVETYPYQEGLRVAKQHIADLGVENDSEAAEKVKLHAPRSAKSERIKKTIYQEILQER